MYWFMDERFRIAYEKAQEIHAVSTYSSGAVDIDEIIKIVEIKENADIKLRLESFSNQEAFSESLSRCGAAMSVTETKKPGQALPFKQARILLNTDWPYQNMRFSLAHELGHIITGNYTVSDSANRFSVSTHIDTDITSFTDEDLKNETLVKEQCANVFALLILMPNPIFQLTFRLFNDKEQIAAYFNVDVNAVNSRLELEKTFNEDNQ